MGGVNLHNSDAVNTAILVKIKTRAEDNIDTLFMLIMFSVNCEGDRRVCVWRYCMCVCYVFYFYFLLPLVNHAVI